MSKLKLKKLSLSLQEYYSMNAYDPERQHNFDLDNAEFGNQCVNVDCKMIEPLRPCPDCGSRKFIGSRNRQREYGVFCHNQMCQTGFADWTCKSCGTKNLTAETFGRIEKGVCFIATAAYGDCDAPEVVFLRAFRDELLSRSILGRGFIQVYYLASPPVAKIVAKSESLRGVVRNCFLQPLIWLLRYSQRK